MTPQQSRESFAASTDHWRVLPADQTHLRRIPIVPAEFRPLINEQATRRVRGWVVNGFTEWCADREMYLAFKTQVKEAMAQAGRADEDWRCTCYRWCNETRFGVACFNFNIGNIHAKPYASRASILSGFVFTDVVGPDGIALINDAGEIVGEFAFSGLASWLRYEKAWLIRNGYGAAIAAMQAGELEGCLEVARVEMSRGYAAGTTVAEDQHHVHNFWGTTGLPWSGQHRLGADWSR